MTTEIESPNNLIKLVGKSEPFWQDFLRNLWLEVVRPDNYMKDQKFSYFWDTKKEAVK